MTMLEELNEESVEAPVMAAPSAMAVSAEAAARLRTAVEHIMVEPSKFDMNDWLQAAPAGGAREIYGSPSHDGFCMTSCCLAGRLYLDAGYELADAGSLGGRNDVSEIASLYIDQDNPGDVEDALFYAEEWPEEFADRYADATTGLERAEALRDRVEHYIATGK